MKKTFLLILITMWVAVAHSQQNRKNDIGTLSGTVYSGTENAPLQNATLQLYQLPDTVYRTGMSSSTDGRFTFSVASGEYLLRLSYVGFLPQDKKVTVVANKNTDVGRIVLSDDVVALKEALVTAEASQITMSEDTTIYNTSAFRVPPGSMLEELIKKYPGVEVAEDGTITINGKTVNRILMKGKDFYGTDKNAALKNIPVDIVDKVKFYDKQSDFTRLTGIDDGEEETVLDLQMKKGADTGFFANIDLAYGTKDRYSLKATPNYFTDTEQISLILSANNINDRGFSGRGAAGLTSAKESKFNFVTTRKNVEFGGNIRYDHRDNDNKSFTSSEYFMTQGAKNQFSNSRNNSLGCNSSFNSNFRLEWKIDTLTTLIFTPSFSYNTSEGWQKSNSATFDADPFETDVNYPADRFGEVYDALQDIAINRNENENVSRNRSKSANADLHINRRLAKQGRSIAFRGGFRYSDSDNKSFSANKVKYYKESVAGSGYDRKRYSDTPGENWSYNMRLSYTEPLLKNLFLQLSYRFDYSYQNSDRATYVFDDIENYFPIFGRDYTFPMLPTDYEQYEDESLSRFSVYRNMRHDVELMFRYVTDKMNLSAGVTWIPQKSKMEYKYLQVDTIVERTVYNFTPNIRMRYKWNKTTTLNIMYRGRTSQPSMTDLLDITDDSNPLNIKKGNPGLKPSFTNNLMAFFNTNNPDTQTGIMANLFLRNTLNSISNKVTYVESTGGRITQPENINGNWSLGGGFHFNSALPRNKKFTYSTNTNISYAHNVSYISKDVNSNSVRNTVETTNLNERLKFGYRNDVFEISLDGSVNYSHSDNEMQSQNNMDTWNFSYGPSGNVKLPWQGLTISTNLSMSSRRGFNDPAFNTNELLWNAQIAASFLKGNALTVTFQLYDILHEQSNISRTINATMRSDTQNNSIYSYGMLHIIYKINTMGDKETRRGMHGAERGFGPPRGPGGGRFVY